MVVGDRVRGVCVIFVTICTTVPTRVLALNHETFYFNIVNGFGDI